MFGLSYWLLPLVAGCVWLGTLLAMLCKWIADGEPQYPWMGPGDTIAYLSSIGSTDWGYPLFIAGSAVTVFLFNLAFVSERWLRHKGRLHHNYSKSEKILSVLAILTACVGGAGLICLTIFDTKRYHSAHDALLVVFIVGYWVSAIFICAEYQRLGVKYREYSILAISFWIKLFFIFLEFALVISFAVISLKQKRYNIAAPIEWVICLVFIFYMWSFIIDFLPATRTRHHHDRFPPVKKSHDEKAMDTERGGNLFGGPVYTEGGRPGDASDGSQAPMTASRNF